MRKFLNSIVRTACVGLILCCLCSYPITSHGQVSNRQLKSTADQLFKAGNYQEALNLYVRYTQYAPNDVEAARNLGICQFENNLLDESRATMQGLMTKGRMANDELGLFYMAEILFHQQAYAEAAAFYKACLYQTRSDDRKQQVLHRLANCEFAQDLMLIPMKGFIENPGIAVNSIADDVMPRYSMNVSDKIYFSSNFDRREQVASQAVKSHDIHSSTLVGGEWKEAVAFPNEFSTDRHEFPLAFINNGANMVFQRGGIGEASILVDTFRQNNDTGTRQFGKWTAPIYPELGDRTINFYGSDVVFFSSSRPGGFGGKDIYYTIKEIDGWSAPINMGATINSPFDEIDPFISNDGNTLYFSSNRREGFGGFDVFNTSYNRYQQSWNAPTNMGAPINSPADDINLVIDPNGNSYLFSSNRKTGYGGYDLYLVYASRPVQDMMHTRGQQPLQFLSVANEKADTAMLPATDIVDNTASDIENSPPEKKEIVFTKSISIAPVYYSAEDVVLNPQSIKTIDQLANLIRQYPGLKLNLLTHSSGYDGPKYFDLYFSARRAEQIITYLKNKNVDVSNITITGIGHQFPYASSSSNVDIAGFANKLNRRIDVFIDGSEYAIGFTIADGGLDEQFIDKNHYALQQLMRGYSYKVLVKKTTQLYKDDVMNQPGFACVEQYGDKKTYYYTVGWSQDKDEIEALAQKLRRDGYPDAKVVSYLDGNVYQK